MILSDFEKLCTSMHLERRKVVEEKRPEYVEGNLDVLYNFKRIADELNLDPMQVAYTYFRKHLMSISQVCKTGMNTSSEPFDKRIADAMNYLELIYALYHERQIGEMVATIGGVSCCESCDL